MGHGGTRVRRLRDGARRRGPRLRASGREPRGRASGRRRRGGAAASRPPPGTPAGAVLVLDEIKTAFRLALGGAAERYGLRPDLVVLGKALANGFPLAVVGGRADLMAGAGRTWISSTLATEGVALAAALATLDVMVRDDVCA